MKLYKELENNCEVKIGTIDTDFMNNKSTINVKINYNGYIKIEDIEMENEIELKKKLVDFLIERIFLK